tara:strand:- start:9385 stop:9600 length:216 start_codon:yes stop_codon:yes gene_type:complete
MKNTNQLKMKSTREQRIKRRNTLIADRYGQLYDKRHKSGARLYTHEAIFAMLSEEFYLAPRTIEDIIFSRK